MAGVGGGGGGDLQGEAGRDQSHHLFSVRCWVGGGEDLQLTVSGATGGPHNLFV